MYRVGFSEDIHPFKEGRKLVLGGVYFPNEVGLDGHSDADVVIHSVAEAILGALCLGDLGTHFPDNDEKYKDIDSTLLLANVVELMDKQGYEINNLDIQVATAHPRLGIWIKPMKERIAEVLKTLPTNVSIKAMSYNKIGEIGEGKACKSQCFVMLKHK